MSVIKNNLSRQSSFGSLKSINNKPQNFIGRFAFNSKKGKRNTSLLNFGFNESNNSLKEKNNKLQNLKTLNLNKNREFQKNSLNEKYPHRSYEYLIKYIRNSFINKYNKAYFEVKNELIYNKNKYFLYDYYKINDILENKKSSLVAKYHEFKIVSSKNELLIRFYKPKERYMIMKYLLNFIYKFDKLCYDNSKEIPDIETKEEIIKTFYYITSEQYIYEHLFDNESFKGVQNLLKYVNLASKKASYDYSYLDMAKNTSISKENEIIINTLKAINEYINNSNFLGRKLIKNFPIETIPNCMPNYFSFGMQINEVLNSYRIQRKIRKIGNHEETRQLINKYREEFLKEESKIQNRNKIQNELFKIQENNEENESEKSDKTSEHNKQIHKDKINYKIILTEMMKDNEDITRSEEYSNELKNNSKEKDNEILNKQVFHDNNKRGNEDLEEREIENLLSIIPKDGKKIYNNINKVKNIKGSSLYSDKRNLPKVKFKVEHLKLKNEYKNNEKYHNLKKAKIENKLIKNNDNNKVIETNSTKHTGLSIINFNETSLKLNKRTINNKISDKYLINSPSINNNFSSLFNETNYLSTNLSPSYKIHKTRYNSFIDKNKENLSIINNKSKNINKQFNFSFNKLKKSNSYGITVFKNTKSFIINSEVHKNKMQVNQNIILKKFANQYNSMKPKNKSTSSILSFQTNSKLGNSDSIKKMRKLYKKSDFQKLVFKLNKRLFFSKKKESKSITFKQILKNCEIYISKLN